MEKALVIERVAQLIRVLVLSTGEIKRGIPRGKLVKKERVYAGDYVLGTPVDSEIFAIEKVQERKNVLIRPPIANVDSVVCVMTIKEPDFDNFLLDNLLVVYDHVGCEPVIVFNKVDLLSAEEKRELERWTDIYTQAGYEVVHVSALSGEGLEDIVRLVKGNICILAGPSGVGKSSILKQLTGEELRTGRVSEKTSRGRHTTTGVKLIPFGNRSFMGDTPGFSKVDALQFVRKKEVKNYFREFLRYECKYPDCSHIREPGCRVKFALKRGEISCERFKSYLKILKEFLEELKEFCEE